MECIRTDCCTGRETKVNLRWEIKFHPELGESYLHLIGGPTGYESMPLKSIGKAIASEGWLACFGTKSRWDRLFVPASSLNEVIESVQATETTG